MTEPDDDLDPVLGELLRRALHQPPDPETTERHLEIIKREAARVQEERRGQRMRPHRHMLIAALVGLLLMAMSGGAVAASGASLPGDLLYPVKLGSEQIRLLIAVSPDADAAVLLDIARRRIAEAQQAVHVRPEAVNSLAQEAMDALDAADTDRDPTLARTASTLRDQATRTVALTDDLDPDQADALQTPTPRGTASSGAGAVSPDPSPSPSGGLTSGTSASTSPSGTAPSKTSTTQASTPEPSTSATPTPSPTGSTPSPSPTGSSSDLEPETADGAMP